MSFLDQFLKEPPLRRAAGGGGSGSVASEDVEPEDSRVPSIASSKSEYSMVSRLAGALSALAGRKRWKCCGVFTVSEEVLGRCVMAA